MRRSLSVARGATATLGTGMKFLDDSAQARIGLPSIVRVDVVHNLVAVVVHLHSAVGQIILSVLATAAILVSGISPEIFAHAPGEVSSPSR